MAKEKEEDQQIRYQQMKDLYLLVASDTATEEQRETLRKLAEEIISDTADSGNISDDDAGSDGNTSDEDLLCKEGKAKEGKTSESASSSTSSSSSSLSGGTSSEGTSSISLSKIETGDSGVSLELTGEGTETGNLLPD